MLDSNKLASCPWCLKASPLKDWDEESYKQCTSREARRAFRSITDERVWKKDSKFFYMCPVCKQISRGNKLKIKNPDNKDEESLGGQPLFNINEK